MNRTEFSAGLRAGLPVCVGYFSVSFGFGAMAANQGLNPWQAALISATTLASAGQFAGLTAIAAGAMLLEIILTQLVINSRYALMSLALGQKFGPNVSVGKRMLCGFFNTDEVFALGMARPGNLSPSFFFAAGFIGTLGWVAGTALGAAAGAVLPLTVRLALGVMLYGMFIAIVVPQARQEKPMLFNLVLALVFSCLFAWVPGLDRVSPGLAIVLCTAAAAGLSAWLFPIAEEDAP